MKCVKCGGEVVFTDPVCPHCLYIKEQDRYAELRKPLVLNKAAAAQKISWYRHWRLWRKNPFNRPRIQQDRNYHKGLLLSIVPGLGHIALGRRWEGILFMIGVGGCLAASTPLYATYGPYLVGVAASLHAWSIVDAAVNKQRVPVYLQYLLIFGLLIALIWGVYYPINLVLAQLFPGSWLGMAGIRQPRTQEEWRRLPERVQGLSSFSASYEDTWGLIERAFQLGGILFLVMALVGVLYVVLKRILKKLWND